VWEGLFAEEVAELGGPWMRVVDELLEDEELVDAVYEAQGQRHGQNRTSGRPQTPAEVALRMLILKHVRNWSYENAGAGSAGQRCLSQLLPDRYGESAGRQDAGPLGTSDWAGDRA